MINDTQPVQRDAAEAHEQGRRQGLAIAALALGMVSFLNLLGAEKSLLAIVLAAGALSGSASRQVRRRAFAAIGLGFLHLVTIGVVLMLFQDEFGQLLQLLRKLA